MAPWQKLQQVADDALAGPDHDQVIAVSVAFCMAIRHLRYLAV